MTNEEAIEILKQFKKCLSDVVFDEKGSEAWQMAIKALSQEPQCTEHPCLGTLCRYYKEPCTDAVSREAVLNLIEKGECLSNGAVMKLPSVNPQPCDDAISREAVNALYDKWRPRLATHVSEFGDELKSLPSVTQKGDEKNV